MTEHPDYIKAHNVFTAVKQVFPDAVLESITIQGENEMGFFKFTKDEVGEQQGGDFELLPSGKYTAMVTNHDWKATKTGGHLLALTFEITGPDKAGRKVFENLNIDNSNEQAQQIAMRDFKALCLAAGNEEFLDAVFDVGSLDELGGILTDHLAEALYNREVELNIGIEKGKDNYPDKNKIKGIAAAQKAAPAPAKKPAWAAKK